MGEILKLFVEDARAVTIADAAQRLGLKCNPRGNEHPQPCPPAAARIPSPSTPRRTNGTAVKAESAGMMPSAWLRMFMASMSVAVRDCWRPVQSFSDSPSPKGRAGNDRAARLERLEVQRQRNAELQEQQAKSQADYREIERKRRAAFMPAHPRCILRPKCMAAFTLWSGALGCRIPIGFG